MARADPPDLLARGVRRSAGRIVPDDVRHLDCPASAWFVPRDVAPVTAAATITERREGQAGVWTLRLGQTGWLSRYDVHVHADVRRPGKHPRAFAGHRLSGRGDHEAVLSREAFPRVILP